MAPSDIRRSSRRATTQAVSYTEPSLTDVSTDSGSPPPATPAKTRGTKRPRAVVEEDEYALSELHGTVKHDEDASDSPLSDLDDSDADASSPKKKKRSPKKTPKKKARHTAAGSTGDEDADMDVDGETASVASASSPTKKKRPTKPKVLKPDPVFDIPDLPESEKKTTTFKGRLGYACLNTVLRNRKPADFAIFCSRTCRIDTIKEKGMDFVKELGRQNVKDLLALIEWNEKNVSIRLLSYIPPNLMTIFS
jgi:UV DNA damage endonuclease